MTAPQSLIQPSGLSEIANDYDAILCDVWGVIHNGRRAFVEACDALYQFRALGRPVVLISNAPVQAEHVEAVFSRVGVRLDCYDAIATSGDATRAEIERRAPGPAWRLGSDEGWERDDKLFKGSGLDYVAGPDAAFIVCMGLRDAVREHPDEYREELAPAAARNLDLVCANPDIQVRVGDELQWCAGALARVYAQLGGPVIYPGKPYPPIYDLAYQKLAGLSTVPLDRSRILAIGDGPSTDILGANRQGLKSLYVGTGLFQTGAGDFFEQTQSLLQEYEVAADYAMPLLMW